MAKKFSTSDSFTSNAFSTTETYYTTEDGKQVKETDYSIKFSNSGKEILVKEKRGSNKFGLYETYAWIYYLTDEDKEIYAKWNEAKKAKDFEEADKYRAQLMEKGIL